jgi:ceramide glucosyltransferase
VILSGILGALAILSFMLMLWQWLAARRFPLHQRTADQSFAPAVTLLKPLKGCDEHTEACLRSWLAQEYRGEIQILFAVADASDPACALIKKLLSEFPQRDAQLIVCPERLGANAKVSKLAQLESHVKHEIIIVSDADVCVPADLLTNVVAPLAPSLSPSDGERVAEGRVTGAAQQVGLVNCFYQLANPTTLAMRWEAIAINADFWSQVLQSQSLKPLDFALGAVMVTRRTQLAEISGFRSLADCLADDYQLGHRIAKRGHRIELCQVVVECWSSPMNWGAVWRHQLRWARTIRVCQPLPYFFSILSNATLWPLLWLLVTNPHGFVLTHSVSGNVSVADVDVSLPLVVALMFLLARVVTASLLYYQMTRKGIGWAAPLLVPFKDLVQVAIWAGAFVGNRVEWRGERYRLRRDGTIEKPPA